jgi:glyoxylase-like metal-dependent hydrolase (beta-lactamase superfamily II)
MQDNASSFTVGEFTCWWISDGHNFYPPRAVLADAPEAALGTAFPTGELSSLPYAALLVDTGGYRILVDTGAGPFAPTTGRLRENIRAADVALETVDVVVVTHCHPDHIGGSLDDAGQLAFPNARFFTLRDEYEYWRQDAILAKLAAGELFGAGALEQACAEWLRRYLWPVEERLELLEGSAEIVPGVQVIPTAGHTPGHLAVMLSSDRDQLLHVGDAFLHPAQIGHPEWNSMFEADRQRAVETRLHLLDRAAADRCLVAATHFPSLGRVARRASGYAWEVDQDRTGVSNATLDLQAGR